MRIIAGEFRGRRLLAPEGQATRPITDRVKQSLFDIVTPLLSSDARVYDCFAGTGSLGLEAISRGVAHTTFFESERSALALLRRNIDALGIAGRCQVIATDIFQWFSSTDAPAGQAPVPSGPAVSVVFLDPPYRFLRERQEDLRQLAERIAWRHLAPGGTVVFRHDAEDALELPALQRYDARTYGGMTLEFLAPHIASKEPTSDQRPGNK